MCHYWVAFCTFSFFNMKKESTVTELMQKIAAAIHTGAMVYLKRQYTAIGIFVVAMAVVLAIRDQPPDCRVFCRGCISFRISRLHRYDCRNHGKCPHNPCRKNRDGRSIPRLVLQRHGYGTDSCRSRAARAFQLSFMSLIPSRPSVSMK